MSKDYNGLPTANAWNVAAWIGRDPKLHRAAVDAITDAKRTAEKRRELKPGSCVTWHTYVVVLFAARTNVLGRRTPDGAYYDARSIKAALLELEGRKCPTF